MRDVIAQLAGYVPGSMDLEERADLLAKLAGQARASIARIDGEGV